MTPQPEILVIYCLDSWCVAVGDEIISLEKYFKKYPVAKMSLAKRLNDGNVITMIYRPILALVDNPLDATLHLKKFNKDIEVQAMYYLCGQPTSLEWMKYVALHNLSKDKLLYLLKNYAKERW